MKWHDALSVWNRSKKDIDASHVWAVPRKGTQEYRDVYNIILRAKPTAVAQRNVERTARATEQLAEVAKAAAERRETARVAGAMRARVMEPEAEERAAPRPVQARRVGAVREAAERIDLEAAYKRFLDESKNSRERATIRQRLRYYTSGDERPAISRAEAIRRVMGTAISMYDDF
jgi:hypothetical protein